MSNEQDVVVKMTHVKSTKTKYVFQGDVNVPSLYIDKTAFLLQPNDIEVTIKVLTATANRN